MQISDWTVNFETMTAVYAFEDGIKYRLLVLNELIYVSHGSIGPVDPWWAYPKERIEYPDFPGHFYWAGSSRLAGLMFRAYVSWQLEKALGLEA